MTAKALAARANVLGCPVDRLSLKETSNLCRGIIDSGKFARQVSVNAAKLVAMRKNERLRAAVISSDIISADGQAIVWASRLLGDRLPGRANGTDLMWELIHVAERYGYGIYILGATKEVLAQAVQNLEEQFPNLKIAGYHDGYFSDDELPAVVESIRAAAPQILFLAISSPKKEYFLHDHFDKLAVPFAMGVGGSIDIVAGITKRAPRWMHSAGMEWLYRVIQEPRRMWRRYLVTNTVFLALLLRAMLARAVGLGR
jgi:N-acetylglucosaminyldiphosphoundecaprenol N-acetyl-beta-D-mannosaminyltransferase